MGTGVGVLAPNAIEAQAKIVGYDKQLRMKSVLEDIYSKLTGLYDTEKKTLPLDAIVLQVDNKVTSESTEAVITMQMVINSGGIYGNTRAVGQEVRPVHKSMKIYRNNLRKVISTPGDGVRELDAKPYGMYEKFMDQLGDWNKAHHGWEYRQAAVEDFGETLVHGDTSANCSRNWNQNIFVAGLSLRQCRPTYSLNRATYTTNIVTKILQSGSGALTPLARQTLNQPNLSNVLNLAMQLRITQLKLPVPGGKGYVITISELQQTYLGDPAWSSRNLGTLFKDMSALPKAVQDWPGVIGMYKNALIIVDPRQPTLLPSGTGSPYGLTAGYVEPTDDEQRNRDNPDTRDTFFCYGAGALWDWTARKLRFIRQEDDYGAIDGRGTSVIRGVGCVRYNQATPTPTSQEQFGMILGICALPDYV